MTLEFLIAVLSAVVAMVATIFFASGRLSSSDKSRRLPALAGLIIVTTTVATIITFSQSRDFVSGAQLADVEAQVAALERENNDLRSRLVERRSIERTAVEELVVKVESAVILGTRRNMRLGECQEQHHNLRAFLRSWKFENGFLDQ